jgi:uncharacterized protein YbjT (DUF2867 family)
MRVLLTGANGYIGKRLLPLLVEAGHEVVCCVRDRRRFPSEGVYVHSRVSVLEIDFLKRPSLDESVPPFDAAYYLIHSMSDASQDFGALEETSATHFLEAAERLGVRQILYLGGIINEAALSRHLESRRNVDTILRSGGIPVTTLKAGIVVGSGSSSFEIIRDLVEKLPVMVTPKWLNTRIQPIAIRDVLQFLLRCLGDPRTFGGSYDIAGPDVLTYKGMLLEFAAVRGLKRRIWTIPVMTPRLSSYWLYFVTSTSYTLAVHLVNSMKVEVVARPNDLADLLGIQPMPYRRAVELAFERIEQNNVISSWKDSLVSSGFHDALLEHVNVPTNGCFFDRRVKDIEGDPEPVLEAVWSIGGETGWYYGDWLWRLRGILDKFFGGVGLRRGRTDPHRLRTGDTLDFWRVLAADRPNRRLLLYAEMKLPGEAWLEFRVTPGPRGARLEQTATYRPKGLLGRAYWYAVLPFHHFVFEGMARGILEAGSHGNGPRTRPTPNAGGSSSNSS